jgi:copper chaperone
MWAILANKFDVSLDRQNVKVWGPSLPPFEEVKTKIGKTGKTVSGPNSSTCVVLLPPIMTAILTLASLHPLR